MAITQRDFTLLHGLGKFRVLTLSQIRTHYFGGLARPLVQRRLSRLRAQNLLRSYPFGEQGTLAWTLTSKAAKLVDKPERIFRRPPNRNTLAHDLAIAGLGLQLAQLGILHEWLSTYEIERSLYEKDRHVPDAIFRLKIGKQLFGPIALEVENTLKSSERINGMLYEYAEWFKVTDLWLFWRKEWMARALKEAAKNRKEPRIWIGINSISSKDNLSLVDLKGNALDVAQMAKDAQIESLQCEKAHQKIDTPSDTHPISEIDPKSVLRTFRKSLVLSGLGEPDSPASAFPDFPDPSLPTIDRGQERKLDYGESGTELNENLGLEGGKRYE